MLCISPTLANETFEEEIGDYCPGFSVAFAQSAQSAETLQNALRYTDKKRRFVVSKHDQSTVLFFTIYSWKQEDIFLLIISIFSVYGQTGIVQMSGMFLSLSSKTNGDETPDLHDSKQYHFCPHVMLQST